MAKLDLASSEWCQLIFEGKNQAYGAYKMRANSTKRHNLAMLAVLVIALIGFTIPTQVKLATRCASTSCIEKLHQVYCSRHQER